MDLFDIDKVLDELEAAENMSRELTTPESKAEETSVQPISHANEDRITETTTSPHVSLTPLDEPPLGFPKAKVQYQLIDAAADQNLLDLNFDEDQPCSSSSIDSGHILIPQVATNLCASATTGDEQKAEQDALQQEKCTEEKVASDQKSDGGFENTPSPNLFLESSSKIIASFHEDSISINDHVTEEELNAYLRDLEGGILPENQFYAGSKADNVNEFIKLQENCQNDILNKSDFISSELVTTAVQSENFDLKLQNGIKEEPDTSEYSDQSTTQDQIADGYGENSHSLDQAIFQSKNFKPVEEAGEALENDFLDEADGEDFATGTPAMVITVMDKPESSDKPLIVKPIRQLATIAPVGDALPDWKPTESELQLGLVEPVWIPDQDSLICMLCEASFTMIKRRHHCRACGRVLCADCCHLKLKLPYMDKKESRVCHSCSDRLQKITEYQSKNPPVADHTVPINTISPSTTGAVLPDPTDPSQPSSSQPVRSSANQPHTIPSVSVRSIDESDLTTDHTTYAQSSLNRAAPQGVLKQGINRRESKSVMFCDGIKPGAGEVGDQVRSKVKIPKKSALPSDMSPKQREFESYINNTGRYLISRPGVLDDWVTWEYIERFLAGPEEQPSFVKFVIKKNLFVVCSALKDTISASRAPNSRICTFASDGLKNVCTDELFIAIVCDFDSGQHSQYCSTFRTTVEDMLWFFDNLYENTLVGKPLTDMSCGLLDISTGSSFLGFTENAGFLYFRPTFQCLKSLHLPEEPYLIGLLFKTEELPWAKILPLRLLLRLGAESNTYPWPIVSDPKRKSALVCGGHTIMNILNDFRNFTYSIAHLTRSSIVLEANNLEISIPKDQSDQVRKIVQSSNENVLAFAGSFCRTADSHLVCAQNETGSYVSQTIGKLDNLVRKVTGCAFVIFNASLKAPGPKIRVSIVEDGIMVQVKPEMMEMLRSRLLGSENVLLPEKSADHINDTTLQETPEKINASITDEVEDEKSRSPTVQIKWENLPKTDLRIHSPVDGLWLGDSARFRLSGRNMEISNMQYLIRLMSIFALPVSSDKEIIALWEPPEDFYMIIQRITVSLATCILSKMDKLDNFRFQTIGIRFVWGLDTVEYIVGFDGKYVPKDLVSTMDDYLVPILGAIGQDVGQSSPAKIELMLRLLRL